MPHLHEFLSSERDPILELVKNKTIWRSSSGLDRGQSIAYDQLTAHLELKNGIQASDTKLIIDSGAATTQGREYFRVGHSIGQVVQGYGAICQAITQSADRLGVAIKPYDYYEFNTFLDNAMADAVTEFGKLQKAEVGRDAVQRISFLTHELRNSLQGASLAIESIKEESSWEGDNNRAIDRSFLRMQKLIDAAISELRTGADLPIDPQLVSVNRLLAEVDITFGRLANNRNVHLSMQVEPGLEVIADYLLLLSAVQNIVQNAIKFTRADSIVLVNARYKGTNVNIDVEDECGGLPEGKIEELFSPFVQKSEDKSGLGLGLAIGRKAMRLNGGTLTVTNRPPIGCTFTITLPAAMLQSPVN